ncbi:MULTISPECIES: tRNA-guanine transglycosylase DpdA [Pectobacterium]|uniref:tRNA-guanine transglycosylase DpdA n=1 Tax=Pectobacterium TaxID=122277 RepID=UPI0018DEF785|nr:tRNA-guanine transglycosylase DpdA [Pectobacterium parmentieri]MBI0552221.1 tRNA-guanine transglycosylase [Pectobacterium parmentieri]MBI0561279.1 tRNA-guanine transglycosylase [Pectobacterium parmentieri]MBI0565484.1 tRNA-guanine transglycosylase [Pectobacterium parmentieri]
MSKLKYFFPDSQDFIDPSFDFFRETRNEHRVRQRDDHYPHEVFSRPYDGMLVSKAVVDGLGGGESKYTRAQRLRYFRNGMKHFFRLPDDMETMGDCGAFTYVNQDAPPYRVEEVIEFYETSRFNYGVSLDHIVFGYEKPGEVFSGEVLAECRRRQDITLTLAQEFLSKSQKSCFTAFGVAHGWSKTSYRQSVESLLAMGYKNITMGGMVPLKTVQILETLEEIKPLLKNDTRVHLLGIARPESFVDFIQLGVTSIDSTTPLQQAFKDRKNNYHTTYGTAYTAVRVPQFDANPSLSRKIKSGVIDQDIARHLERDALHALFEYDKGSMPLAQTLEAVLAYERLHAGEKEADKIRLDYERTLVERPWKKCQCDICKAIGINVIIFRGAERNRRRGFHNIQVLYSRLQRTLSQRSEELS